MKYKSQVYKANGFNFKFLINLYVYYTQIQWLIYSPGSYSGNKKVTENSFGVFKVEKMCYLKIAEFRCH